LKFKWVLIGFVIVGIVGFGALLPFAHSIAREIRRSADQFPADLARFEQLLRSDDISALHASLSAALRQSYSEQELLARKESLLAEHSSHLRPIGEYSAFGWGAEWVDEQGQRVSELRFEFWWEEGQHKLRRVLGVLEPNRKQKT
jgi:hypothetical protein